MCVMWDLGGYEGGVKKGRHHFLMPFYPAGRMEIVLSNFLVFKKGQCWPKNVVYSV